MSITLYIFICRSDLSSELQNQYVTMYLIISTWIYSIYIKLRLNPQAKTEPLFSISLYLPTKSTSLSFTILINGSCIHSATEARSLESHSDISVSITPNFQSLTKLTLILNSKYISDLCVFLCLHFPYFRPSHHHLSFGPVSPLPLFFPHSHTLPFILQTVARVLFLNNQIISLFCLKYFQWLPGSVATGLVPIFFPSIVQ